MEDESLALDPLLDYSTVEGLSSEVRERLVKVRPSSIVSRIFFITCTMILYTDQWLSR